MVYLKDAWWNDLSELRVRTEKAYEKAQRDLWQVTAERMIALREWKTTEEKLIPVLQEFGIYYVPKTLIPGPMFVFPESDVAGRVTRAQTKPLHDLFGEGKYHTLGVKKEAFLGPVWLGNSDRTLQTILDKQYVVVVEGPFDLIAAKILAPNVPILCSLTKSIGNKHEEYLKILGVKEVRLLYDNDDAGDKSAYWLGKLFGIPITKMTCPGSDPSDCLKSVALKQRLNRVLNHEE